MAKKSKTREKKKAKTKKKKLAKKQTSSAKNDQAKSGSVIDDPANNPPPCIKKKGIFRATTNLKEGEELNVSRYIWLFFGDAIKERYLTYKDKPKEKESSLSEDGLGENDADRD